MRYVENLPFALLSPSRLREGLGEGLSASADPQFTGPPPTPPAGGRGEEGAEGFSLIEAMVALAILAIATVGLIRTTETHIDSTRGMEQRAVAMWVAENRLAELEIGLAPPDQVEMLGQAWRVAVRRTGTDDPEIERVRIEVFAGAASGPSASPLASLDGFLDAGAA